MAKKTKRLFPMINDRSNSKSPSINIVADRWKAVSIPIVVDDLLATS